jgi:hypothetical protein
MASRKGTPPTEEREEARRTTTEATAAAATTRSLDETRDNIRRAIEETRSEIPKQSQKIIDYQNETAEATREIAESFLESQKDVVNSMQSALVPFAERTGYYWTGAMQQPWYWMGISPRDMAEIYVRTISAMADNTVAATRIATNMMFAGTDAARTITNNARQNAREMARITSNSARAFGDASRRTMGEKRSE